MRLRNIPGSKELLLAEPQLVLRAETAPRGCWRQHFLAQGSRAEKLCLEIGCGRGRFANTMAQDFPELNIIGLEKYDSVLAKAVGDASATAPANLAFLWLDAHLLGACFAPGELNRIYLNFSDPWPKAKHAKRRLTHSSFLLLYKELLAPDGELLLKTDNRNLFAFSADSLLAAGWRITELDWDYALQSAPQDRPTEYEMRFRRLGQPIFRLCARQAFNNIEENTLNQKNFEVKPMQYISTRGGEAGGQNAAAAIRQGLAADGGLFVPEALPAFEYSWQELQAMSYQTLATKILGLFLTDYQPERLQEIVAASYGRNFAKPEIAPLVKLADGLHILELWQGPTAAFKDMALQILPRLLTEAVRLQGDSREIDVLVATSGDTGKAALEGFKNVPDIQVICFYPHGGVSQAQYLQMATTDGENTHVVAIKGNFDNCQSGVKQIFADEEMQRRMAAANKEFSSANSINWGRLCPQIVYYFWSYAELLRQGSLQPGESFNVVVPTGNFGNILAAYYAKEMGLPVGRLICASNSNKVLADVLATGVYDRQRDFVKTTSPSMDILVSSNFERFYYAMTGGDVEKVRAAYADLAEKGCFKADAEAFAKWQTLMSGGYATEDRVAATIKKYFNEQAYALDPHTAVAVAVYEDYLAQSGDKRPVVVASTASPFKFGRAVLAALGEPVAAEETEAEILRRLSETIGQPIHQALRDLEQRPVLHKQVAEAVEMPQVVCDLLKI